MTPTVLVHGGGLDRRCWDPLLPHLDGEVLAVDLPGRGSHPGPLESVTFADCLQDLIVQPEKQLRFAGNVGGCPVIDVDAGHMCMVSRPEAVAAILNRIRSAPAGA